jgi:hypothetical protein
MSAPQTIDAAFLPEFPVPVREPRRLHVVDAPTRRRVPRRAFGVVAVLGAVMIALVQMGLSILTTQSSFEIASLTQQQRDLTYQKQILYDDVAGLNSPQYLAANAAALGMVIDETPTYLRLSDGAVVGAGKPAEGTSSVDAMGRGSVRNALISGVPLVTDPKKAAEPAPVTDAAPTDASPAPAASATPPPISDGLPTPATR